MTNRTVAIVQARMGSTRLLPLLGEPALTLVLRRLERARTVDEVVVATTALPEDAPIVELTERLGYRVVRGSETDLLDRYLAAARAADAAVVVRITSDCPLIDPEVVDLVVESFRRSGVEYASNMLVPWSFPVGLAVEVVRRDALERAGREDTDPAWREHATPYLYRHPELFRLLRVPAESDHSERRWTLDTPQDYALIERIFEALGRDDFTWRDALAVVEANPSWGSANRDVVQKVVPPADRPR
jgi:spore coat polysaccharide biosynthesis protein SpsF (cytidylyltransferase family)